MSASCGYAVLTIDKIVVLVGKYPGQDMWTRQVAARCDICVSPWVASTADPDSIELKRGLFVGNLAKMRDPDTMRLVGVEVARNRNDP